MYEAKCLVMDYTNHAAPTATQPPPQIHHQFHQLHPLAPDTSSRWTQYQQLWRQHHMFINGKSCGKESPDKKDDSELWSNVEAQAAFLGPNLWEKTLSYDSDLKYVDLDEFLSENGIPVEGGGVGVGGGGNPVVKDTSCGRISPPNTSQPPGMLPKRERSPSPSEPMSPLTINPPSPADSTLSFASSSRDFDPRTRAFSDEELKPQPMVKKSRKQFVPDGLKDEKYWARRRKNNMAAKRSRDARRLKENQIALRAGFLEKENLGLRQEMERLKKENMTLRDRLSKYTTEI
ncbi:hepatic leukemia factor-like isoform X6 [Macrosteles quadrilineatus]|uniref:hepatic leukemia factor-like isoform X6 n=1 Tax=Macrosteles quadrilineatus TaxID=74068 RepID=UPI0023E1DC6C|nr:hepatic leukemia factor-like isoform X6 [Macrosteles quadrilineatus]